MKILDNITIENVTISVNDSWDIGNNIKIVVKELFEIDGVPYLSSVTENQEMPLLKYSAESQDSFRLSRYINPAEFWIKKNKQLFEAK